MHSDWTTIPALRVEIKDPDETMRAALAEFCLTVGALRVKVKDPDVSASAMSVSMKMDLEMLFYLGFQLRSFFEV